MPHEPRPLYPAVAVLRRQLDGGEILEPFTLGMEECRDERTEPPAEDEGMWAILYEAGREIGRAALGLE